MGSDPKSRKHRPVVFSSQLHNWLKIQTPEPHLKPLGQNAREMGPRAWRSSGPSDGPEHIQV